MVKKSMLAAAFCAAIFAGASASALRRRGEGPPGSAATAQPGGNPNSTGALEHANSACARRGGTGER